MENRNIHLYLYKLPLSYKICKYVQTQNTVAIIKLVEKRYVYYIINGNKLDILPFSLYQWINNLINIHTRGS